MNRSKMSGVIGMMTACVGLTLGTLSARAQDTPPAPKTAVLNGTVMEAGSDAPLEGATVAAGGHETQTGTDGAYSLSLTRSGPVGVHVFKQGYRTAEETTILSFDEPKTLDFRLLKKGLEDRPGGDETGEGKGGEGETGDDHGGHHEGEARTELELRVIDKANGSPIDGAEVVIGTLTGHTHGEGEFEAEHLAPGDYTLKVSASGYIPVEQSVTLIDGKEVELTVALERSGEAPPPPAQDTGDVSVTVNDVNTGAAIGGAFVRIGSVVMTAGTDGAATFSDLPTGEVKVIVRAEGYLPAVQRVTITKDAIATAAFTLEKRPAPKNDTGDIQGVVVSDETGDPIPSASVKVGDAEPVKTGEGGDFSLNDFHPGLVTLIVSAEGFKDRQVRVVVRPGKTAEVTVKLEKTETSPAPDPVAGSLTGVITSCPDDAFAADGSVDEAKCTTPVAGAVVEAAHRHAVTDADGNYTLTGIPVGSTEVEVHKAGFQSAERDVEITADTVSTLNLILFARQRGNDDEGGDDNSHQGGKQGTGKITGVVSDESGQAIEGAVVMLKGVRMTTDGSGRYEFDNLRDGHYSLHVWADGLRPTHKRVEVEDGEAVTADVTLHPRTAAGDEDKGGDDHVGDADDDDQITVADAIAVLRAALGLDDLSLDALKKARLDVAPAKPGGDFGDGEIDVRDAIKLLKVTAQLDKVLP